MSRRLLIQRNSNSIATGSCRGAAISTAVRARSVVRSVITPPLFPLDLDGVAAYRQQKSESPLLVSLTRHPR